MADWVTISSLATAGGTLVLAVATFSSVRSANRSARVAERSLMVGLRPVLIPSREDDPVEHVRFGDEQLLTVAGHGGVIVVAAEVVYMSIGVRNGGSGLAVIHGWHVEAREGASDQRPDVEDFRRQQLDIYIPPGDNGTWLGALRDQTEDVHRSVREAAHSRQGVVLDLLYGDHEGGQRTIVRFVLAAWPGKDGDGRRVTALRYWNVDREDPR
ncbi:MAG: hypothetical protein M3016_06735 [Actinomycetota bacterium]|nr:hypothetical protein [Actinomycetota bacterium]